MSSGFWKMTWSRNKFQGPVIDMRADLMGGTGVMGGVASSSEKRRSRNFWLASQHCGSSFAFRRRSHFKHLFICSSSFSFRANNAGFSFGKEWRNCIFLGLTGGVQLQLRFMRLLQRLLGDAQSYLRSFDWLIASVENRIFASGQISVWQTSDLHIVIRNRIIFSGKKSQHLPTEWSESYRSGYFDGGKWRFCGISLLSFCC